MILKLFTKVSGQKRPQTDTASTCCHLGADLTTVNLRRMPGLFRRTVPSFRLRTHLSLQHRDQVLLGFGELCLVGILYLRKKAAHSGEFAASASLM